MQTYKQKVINHLLAAVSIYTCNTLKISSFFFCNSRHFFLLACPYVYTVNHVIGGSPLIELKCGRVVFVNYHYDSSLSIIDHNNEKEIYIYIYIYSISIPMTFDFRNISEDWTRLAQKIKHKWKVLLDFVKKKNASQ